MNEEIYEIVNKVTLNKVDENTFAVSCNGKIFYVGKILFEITELLKQRKTIDLIEIHINEKFGTALTKVKLEETISELSNKLLNTSKSNSTLYLYIYGRLKIFNEKKLIKITSCFKFLFREPLIIPLCILSLVLTFYFFGTIISKGLFFDSISLGQSFTYFAINYLFIIVIGLFHEIGHSTASSKYGVESNEIGFGFYLIFPVFYTEITKIWLLDRKKRLAVNLAGIYFQLLANIILVITFLSFSFSIHNEILIKTLFFTNCTLLVYAINPFMRNDGYWVYSDYFKIPNLTSEAKKYPKSFLSDYILNETNLSGKSKITKLKSELPLMIYSILLHVIIVAIYFGLIMFTIKNYMSVMELIHNKTSFDNLLIFENIYRLMAIVLSIVINVIFVYRVIKSVLFKQNINHSLI